MSNKIENCSIKRIDYAGNGTYLRAGRVAIFVPNPINEQLSTDNVNVENYVVHGYVGGEQPYYDVFQDPNQSLFGSYVVTPEGGLFYSWSEPGHEDFTQVASKGVVTTYPNGVWPSDINRGYIDFLDYQGCDRSNNGSGQKMSGKNDDNDSGTKWSLWTIVAGVGGILLAVALAVLFWWLFKTGKLSFDRQNNGYASF